MEIVKGRVIPVITDGEMTIAVVCENASIMLVVLCFDSNMLPSSEDEDTESAVAIVLIAIGSTDDAKNREDSSLYQCLQTTINHQHIIC